MTSWDGFAEIERRREFNAGANTAEEDAEQRTPHTPPAGTGGSSTPSWEVYFESLDHSRVGRFPVNAWTADDANQEANLRLADDEYVTLITRVAA